ncbi:MAG TPA: hypothetical protein VKU94_02815 [Geobacterales bacterium]|nr:hypothetical protein [Geobacterales bacterium]
MRRKLARKIRLYIRRYNRDSYRSNKIIEALNLIEKKKIILVYPKIKRYKIFLIEGNRGTYLTVKNTYCSCIGFTAGLMKDKIKPCYHLLAADMIKEDQAKKLYIEPEKLYEAIIKHGLESIIQS